MQFCCDNFIFFFRLPFYLLLLQFSSRYSHFGTHKTNIRMTAFFTKIHQTQTIAIIQFVAKTLVFDFHFVRCLFMIFSLYGTFPHSSALVIRQCNGAHFSSLPTSRPTNNCLALPTPIRHLWTGQPSRIRANKCKNFCSNKNQRESSTMKMSIQPYMVSGYHEYNYRVPLLQQ